NQEIQRQVLVPSRPVFIHRANSLLAGARTEEFCVVDPIARWYRLHQGPVTAGDIAARDTRKLSGVLEPLRRTELTIPGFDTLEPRIRRRPHAKVFRLRSQPPGAASSNDELICGVSR